MITETITELPIAPSTSDPVNFRSRADSFLAALNTFAPEMNTVISEINSTAQTINDAETSAVQAKDAAVASANFLGTWSGATAYTVGQSVYYNGIIYRALQAGTNKQPDTQTTYWASIATASEALLALINQKASKTGDTMTGNLVFASGTKIQGDFSNASWSSKTAIQSNITNGITAIPVIPNGTATTTQLRFYSKSDVDNASIGSIGISDSTGVTLNTSYLGSGTTLPILFTTGGVERMRIDASGNTLVTGSGGLGYGTGSGGTVTQLTSKSTAVTLNKPCGRITMHNASLSGGSSVWFQVLCSSVEPTDTVVVGFNANIVGVQTNYTIQSVTAGNANFIVNIKNISGGALAEAVQLNFSIIKAVTA